MVRRNEPKFHIQKVITSAIAKSVRDKKYRCWEELVGYTLEDLMKRLENQFQEGMVWSNYGKWHIDHIKPISKWNFISCNDMEFKQCWSLSNLQPLWAIDNIRKSNRWA